MAELYVVVLSLCINRGSFVYGWNFNCLVVYVSYV